ncbi:MAG: MFS transporter [Elusimicrobia bacterium]|nr:MFS transporter [Elusimicrobiota bacterium]
MRFSVSALSDSNSRRLLVGQLTSQACDKMMSVGLVWMFADRYSASIIPWFLAFSALPHLLLAWHAGRLTTKLGQLRTLVWTDVFRGLVFTLLALAWSGLGNNAEIYALFGASFIANIASALFNPTILGFPTELVDESRLQHLTAMIESCFSIGNVVGPLLTALLYPWLRLRGLFLFNGLSYIFAAVMEAGIRPRKPLPSAEEKARPQLQPIRKLLAGDPLVTLMLSGFLLSNLFLTPIMVFLPLFVKVSYHGAINTFALLETTLGIGTVAGGLILAVVHLHSKLGRNISVSMAAVALCYLGFTLSGRPLAGGACLGALGFFLATANVFILTFFQTRVSPENLPTLMSLVNLISVASLPFSMSVVGLVIETFDIRKVAIVCAMGLAATTAGVLSRRQLRCLGT